MLDTLTTISYINKMGGTHSASCIDVARIIWAKSCDIWLSAAHISGVDNIIADYKSRNFKDNTEWMLNPSIFLTATASFGYPDCGLFAIGRYHLPDETVANINHSWRGGTRT